MAVTIVETPTITGGVGHPRGRARRCGAGSGRGAARRRGVPRHPGRRRGSGRASRGPADRHLGHTRPPAACSAPRWGRLGCPVFRGPSFRENPPAGPPRERQGPVRARHREPVPPAEERQEGRLRNRPPSHRAGTSCGCTGARQPSSAASAAPAGRPGRSETGLGTPPADHPGCRHRTLQADDQQCPNRRKCEHLHTPPPGHHAERDMAT
jgi:hypothetical protein